MDDPIQQATVARPWLFPYALLLPAAWIGLGALVQAINPEWRLGMGGTALFFVLMAYAISWLFYKRNGRVLENAESWRLTIYCAVLAIVAETWVILAAMAWPEDFGIEVDPDAAKFAIGFAAIVDTLIMVLAFRVMAPKFMTKYVLGNEQDAV